MKEFQQPAIGYVNGMDRKAIIFQSLSEETTADYSFIG